MTHHILSPEVHDLSFLFKKEKKNRKNQRCRIAVHVGRDPGIVTDSGQKLADRARCEILSGVN